MRILTAVFTILLLSAGAPAQTSSTAVSTATLPTTVYEQSLSLVDPFGNLVVVDYGAYLTSTTITLRNGATRAGVARSPRTRITVVRPSKTEVVEYEGRIEVFALGQKALYAVIDTTTDSGSGTAATVTRNLVALTTGAALPAAAGGFPSTIVNPYAALRTSGPDIFTLVDPLPSANSTSTRTGQVLTFNGAAFAVSLAASLP